MQPKMNNQKCFNEESAPVKEVSKETVKEKYLFESQL